MYEPLREKNLFNAQRSDIIRRFDLNKESWLAKEIIHRVEEALIASEEEESVQRLYPGQLLTVCRGKRVVLPLLTEEITENLLYYGRFKSAKHQVIAVAQATAGRQIPGVKANEVKKIIAPRELIPHNGYGKYCPPKSTKYLTGKLAPPEKVGAKPRKWPAEADIWLPAEVVDSLVDYLTREEGISAKKANAMIFRLAYLQGGLLSLMDLQQLFLRSYQTFSRLMRRFMQEQGYILPTPGTVLDAGKAMTHKDIIINHYLDGYYSREIARMTWHSPEAVDRYIDDFEKVMVLFFYGLPPKLISRVMNRGLGVVQEYLQLIEEHFPDKENVKSHLRRCGVEIS